MDHIDRSIDDLQQRIADREAEIAKLRHAVNALCEVSGRPLLFAEVDPASAGQSMVIRSDQFYGRPLATVVAEVLELRKARNVGPATVAEIYQALVDGGFKFETKDEDNAKRALRISLSKNTTTFHKLPNGEYGLLKWYPNAKPPKPAADTAKESEELSEGSAPDNDPREEGGVTDDAVGEKKAASEN